jgi:hypothetical protein
VLIHENASLERLTDGPSKSECFDCHFDHLLFVL